VTKKEKIQALKRITKAVDLETFKEYPELYLNIARTSEPVMIQQGENFFELKHYGKTRIVILEEEDVNTKS
jgi:hypothetical protein